MTKKYILNDNEVATNEDVQSNDEWNSQTLYRIVEAIQSGTFTSSSGLPVVPGSILAGFDLVPSTTNLSYTVRPGSGFFSFPTVDPLVNGTTQMASLESDYVLSLPVASVAEYRWDLVEVSATKTVSSSLRGVVGGGSSAPVPTLVPKLEENQLSFRVRSGPPNASRSLARIPDLDLSNEWIPLAAIEVSPSALTANTLQVLDLRKKFSRIRHQEIPSSGRNYCSGFASFDEEVVIDRQKVTTGNYESILTQVFTSSTSDKIRLNPNSSFAISSGLTITPGLWYYAYAYRPSSKAGYCSVFLTDVPPSSGLSLDPGIPSGPVNLPPPFTTPVSGFPSHYLGAVKFYQDGPTLKPIPFRKQGNMVIISGESLSSFAGATTQNKVHSSGGNLILGGTTQTATINPDGDGMHSVPPHVRAVRLNLQFEVTSAATSGLSFRLRSGVDPFTYYRVSIDPGAVVCPSVDIPLPDDGSTQISVEAIGLPADIGGWRAWVTGYFEEIS
tara:strand:- start:274 stop:1773 length:1500 start_codon:yes stop_codon:yes gene_type:complete